MFEFAWAGPETLAALAALERSAFERPWSEAQLSSLLRPAEGRAELREFALVAFALAEDRRTRRRAAGYIAWQRVFDEATLLSLAVDPDFRRRGLAAGLMRASLRSGALEGVRCLLLEVAEDNGAARAFYAREGFAPDGRVRDYYGRGKDALRMSRLLPPAPAFS